MRRVLFAFLLVLSFVGCSTPNAERVLADSLIANSQKYLGKTVEIEGTVVHVCGANAQKMKLKTEKGSVIMIAASAKIPAFSRKLSGERIRVVGLVRESVVDSVSVSKAEKQKSLLCHIDNTPCKDSAWVRRQIDAGRVDSLSQRDIRRLRSTMSATGKSFVATVVVEAVQIEVIRKENR